MAFLCEINALYSKRLSRANVVVFSLLVPVVYMLIFGFWSIFPRDKSCQWESGL